MRLSASFGARITEPILPLQIMYQLQDSDYYISGFFVVAALVLLNLWLVSLIVAAVVKAFQSIRAEGKSGFGGEYVQYLLRFWLLAENWKFEQFQ